MMSEWARVKSKLDVTTAVIMLLMALACWGRAASADDWVYSARPGDNLWNLAAKHLTRGIYMTRKLQAYNRISDPVHILPGTRIRFPVAWLKVQPSSAKVVALTGNPLVTAAQGEHPKPARLAQVLPLGSEIRTEPDQRAVIEFADGSRMEIFGNSRVRLDFMSAYGDTGMVDTRTRLVQGRTSHRVNRAKGAGSRYEIRTPAAVAAVRGTSYRASADPGSGLSRSEVTEGKVLFGNELERVEVAAGFGIVATPGKPPNPSRALLAPPDLSTVPDPIETLQIIIEFPKIANASAYRIQLYEDGASGQLLFDRTSQVPSLAFEAPPDGRYRMIARAVDDQGLEGRDAIRSFEIDARPVPPGLRAPHDDTIQSGAGPTVTWSQPTEANDTRLQVAKDAQFADIVLDADISGDQSSYDASALNEVGRYHWRMRSRAGSEQGPWSVARSWRHVPTPKAVELQAPDVGETTLAFSWLPVEHATRYRFQLATDESFESIVTERVLQEPSISLERPYGGTYFYRVQAVSQYDIEGPFGATFRFEVPRELWPFLVPLLVPILMLL
jgi:hypothetical protein